MHTIYSDGKNKIETMVKRAEELNFDFISITDHFSNTWKADIIKTLDSYRKINNYIEKISAQNEELKAKNSKLRVLKGIEVDLGSSQKYITSLINPSKFDLILLEYLHSPESIGFAKNLIQEWEYRVEGQGGQLPLFGLAHFDPARFIMGNIELVLTFLSDFEVYFEFNSAYSAYYATKYKKDFFDKFAEFNILVGIGADAHSVNELDYVREPLDMIKYYGLENNLFQLIKRLQRFK
jgi:histidinol phosphatase-like PHP family hydrolase